MKSFFKNISLQVGASLLIFTGVGITFAALSQVNEGDSLTHTMWNEVVDSLNNFSFDSGNIGIGTNLPSSKVHIKDSTAPVVSLEYDDIHGAYGELLFQEDGSNSKWGISVLSDSNTASGAENRFQIYQYSDQNNTSVNTNRLVINDSGNVGIGVPAPTEKLEVDGNIVADNHGPGATTHVSASVNSTTTGTSISWSSNVYATCPSGYSLTSWALTGSNTTISSGTYHYCQTGKQDDTQAYVRILNNNNNANYSCTVTAFCHKD